MTRQIADIEAKNEDAARKLRLVSAFCSGPTTSFYYSSSAYIGFVLRNPDAACTVNKHIELLHTYNEIRDVGTSLMGIIADNRGVRVKDVYRDFDVGEKD